MNFKPGDIIELEKNPARPCRQWSSRERYRILLVLSIENARIKTFVLKSSTKYIKDKGTLMINNHNTRYYKKRV